MTRPLRERLDARRRLIATDLSGAMLEHARGKMTDLDITWQTADAMKLPFGDGEFGAVACSLGLMFMPDKAEFLRGVKRVLKPGGRFLFNVWDRVEENSCARIYAQVLEEMFPGDAEVHFHLPYHMHDREELRTLVDGAGFLIQRMETVRMTMDGVAPRQIATGQVRGTPRGLLLAQRGVAFEDAIDRVAAAIERGGPNLHCQAIVVEALAPD